MKNFLFLLLPLSILIVSCDQAKDDETNYLVVLSMDGFRWDYPDKTPTPNLDSIARNGVKAGSFVPAFPSKTFPNHYTMATGLYPDNHGLVNNTFYDAETNAIYRIRDSATRNNPRYYGGEPIWVTAAKSGMTTASFYWVGSEVPIKGVQPDYWKSYDGSFPYVQRVDTIIYWLSLPEEQRPELIMWYFDEPDAIGHRYGPDHPKTLAKVTYIDSLVGVFCRKVNMLPHAGRINLIFLSDHGMAEISKEKAINLDEIIPETWVEHVVGGNPNYNIATIEGFEDSVYYRLKKEGNIQVWKNGEVPERLNYGKNPRTLDLTVVANPGWSIHWKRNPGYSNGGGTHGYEPAFDEMHAIFYATGPSFKKNWQHPSLENVNLYVLMCQLLGLQPATNDGKTDYVKGMLK